MLEIRQTPAQSSTPISCRISRTPWKLRGVVEVRAVVASKTQHLAIDGSSLHTHQGDINGNGSLTSWSLEDMLSSLDSHSLPPPSAHNFARILRKYKKEGNPNSLLRVLAHIRTFGLDTDPSLGNQLVPLLVEFGCMRDAQQVFDRLEVRNQSSYNSLITGYVKCGKPHLALSLYERIEHEGSMYPSGHALVALVKACTKLKNLDSGSRIHVRAATKGVLRRHRFLGSALVDMYAKCGSLPKAQALFNKLPLRDVVSWNALIAGYAKQGCGEEALELFSQMRLEGISPTAVTYVCILNACGSLEDAEKVKELHEEVTKNGFEEDLHVGSALVDMYAKCGLLDKAEDVFRKLPVRNVVSWTALIKGCAEHNCAEEALHYFDQMQHEGVFPDAVAFLCVIKACSKTGAVVKGQELHAEISRMGLGRDILVGCTLIDMYNKFGLLGKAQEVFDMLPVKDVMVWNTLMGGLVEHEFGEEALQCYEEMRRNGICPNAVSFVFGLKACASLANIRKGCEIHAQVSDNKLDKDLLVGSSLVDMYAKCGALTRAREVFESLAARDVVSWTALIAGYAERGHGQEALDCYDQMQQEGLSPNAITFACSLKACGIEGAVHKAQEIHTKIARTGLLEKEPIVGNALIDMYAKCGLLVKAQEVFETYAVQNVVSWNALIAGYAQLGESSRVFCMLNQMAECGELPDMVTFVSVLNACTHAGLVDLGVMYFDSMRKDYGVIPTLEHHTCLVDLLGRAGQLEKALHILNEMRLDPDLVVWHALLGACQKWGNVELGRQVFEQAVCLNGLDATAYVSLSNIHLDDNDDA